MRTPPATAGLGLAGLAAIIALGGLTGCSSAGAADLQVGDCLKVGGTPDQSEATEVACGSPESNFKVAATVESSDLCPTDIDSYYSMSSAFSDTSDTVCMDIDWVVGGCMSIDPKNGKNPFRVGCNDPSAPNRRRATQILRTVASVDQCASGVGYAYDERQFTVCVEDVA
jgi:hypothetical protein